MFSGSMDPEGEGVNAADDPHVYTPSKIKKRLNEVFPLVDLNGDGQVDYDEMLKRLQIEHTKQEGRARMSLPVHAKKDFEQKLQYLDKDQDGKLSFDEIKDHEEVMPKNLGAKGQLPSAFTMAEDKKAEFDFADKNGDGQLDLEDYQRLTAPAVKCKEENIKWVLGKQLKKVDKNDDGKISWEEYVDSVAGQAFKHGIRDDALEKYMAKEHQLFAKHDLNNDDKLDFNERKAWMFPEETGEMLKYEANHLITAGDANADGKLSYQEMFDAGAYYIGGRLQTPDHDEL